MEGRFRHLLHLENTVGEPVNPDEVHTIDKQREAHHNGRAKDGAKADHQKPSAARGHELHRPALEVEAEQEIAQNCDNCENEDQIRDRLTNKDLAVDPSDGVPYVLFYDRRGDPKNLLATMTLARSTDGGRTFANYAWSLNQSDPKQASLGDYISLTALEGRVYGAWPETVPIEKWAPRKSQTSPGGIVPDDLAMPWGPAPIRVGIADFRKK